MQIKDEDAKNGNLKLHQYLCNFTTENSQLESGLLINISYCFGDHKQRVYQ